MNLLELGALATAQAIRSGEVTSEQLVQACLDRIRELDESVQAWAFLDPERALAQARAADLARRSGRALGPLHGIPVGIKDILDTYDMPTEDGTVLHAGRKPTNDATAVAFLRRAGAVILGKTVTTEFAVYTPGKTRNPRNPEHTPGGSSSGSAAAVAAGMAPLAVGTQTNGSVLRPASYCGVVGYKPTHGLISRHGVLVQSRPLDHVGVFARSIDDAALLAEPLMGYDDNDPDLLPRARPNLLETARQDPPVLPRLAFVKSPVWDKAEQDTQEAFAELVEHVNERAAAQEDYKVGKVAEPAITELELPPLFGEAHGWHKAVMEADIARNFERDFERGGERMSVALREMIERGRTVRAVDYNRALDGRRALNDLLDDISQEFDAILTPVATGEAPRGLDSTGSPTFCTIWTFCGAPAITLPLLQGANDLPIGVQLVAGRGDDARLLRVASWLARTVSA